MNTFRAACIFIAALGAALLMSALQASGANAQAEAPVGACLMVGAGLLAICSGDRK